jgi:hypothetical protein
MSHKSVNRRKEKDSRFEPSPSPSPSPGWPTVSPSPESDEDTPNIPGCKICGSKEHEWVDCPQYTGV